MKILILEDDNYRVRYFEERLSKHDIEIYDVADDAIEALKRKTYDILFLDNDLGENAGSGTDVADFLHSIKDNKNNNAIIIVHSWNVPAATAMKGLLPRAYFFPYGSQNFLNIFIDI
jgi:DNA-binding response OmpR family regulator